MYNGFGVYRFISENGTILYIGKSNTIRSRIYNQHFTERGHLPNECYDKTAKVDIIPLKNSVECTSLEAYLINKYKPRYNKRDKERKLNIKTPFDDRLDVMEKGNWKTYRTFRKIDANLVRTKNKESFATSFFAIAIYVFVLGFLLVNYI